MSYWEKKVALVVGGSTGLGKAIAAALAERGANVVLAARDSGRLGAAVEELKRQGDVVATECDATDPRQVDDLVRQTVERFGRLDLLVNSIGRSSRGRVLDATPDQFREMIDVNFLAAVNTTRAAAEHLLASRGHLVNIGSLASKTASPHLALYSPGKFALAAYTHQLRLELAPQGLHVLLVCPGPIVRDDAQKRYAEQAEDLPSSAAKPGGGARIKGIDAGRLARQVLRACERRKAELVVPGKAKWLFAISNFSPALGDWILRRMTDS